MPRTALPTDTLTREEAIARLRNELVNMTDEENCACKVAADRGIFCGGFRRYTEQELREHYWWIVRRRPEITRAELEKIANDWQLAQQDVQRLPLACDVQTRVHDTCKGWHDFTNEQLEKFYWQMTGKEVRIG
jgi:hypothetical protein